MSAAFTPSLGKRPPAALAATLFVAFLSLFAAPAWPSEIAFPALSGRVVDEAGVIGDETERAISLNLEALEQKTSHQLVVVTLKSLQGQPIEEFGYRLGRHWGIGRAKEDDGTLLIVAPNEREVRIEVGYGLEGDLTDALSRAIIEQVIVPRFRDGDIEGGVAAGAGALITALGGEAGATPLPQPSDPADGFSIWHLLFIVALIMFSIWHPIAGFFLGSIVGGKRRGGWCGGFGGGSFGGGGFSGGGGGFGGGGATGRW